MSYTEEEIKQQAIRKSSFYITSNATAAVTINSLHQDSMDVSQLMRELSESFGRVKDDNFLEIEAMLLSQAHTLNVFFHRCLSQVGDSEWMPQIQTMSDLALRTQNNCRKTLATLAEMKNPNRSTFIKQQNNAINQQVNNSENLKNNTNELLEAHDDQQRLDTRTTFETITTNPQMETVEISRGKNSRRQSNQ